MVLCGKSKNNLNINLDENFFLGPPDYSKFTPASITNFASHRRVWLLSENLVKQTKINPLHDNNVQRGKNLDSITTTVVRCGNPITSTPQEKKEMFIRTLTSISSCIYGVFIVTLGVVIYIGEIISGNAPLAELYSIYLVIAGIAYLTFLYTDMRQFSKILKISEELFLARYGTNSEPPSMHSSIGQASVNWASLSEPDLVLPHHYCFLRGRHNGSFYLKLGAAGFCLGHLIHSGLLISYQVTFLITQPYMFYKCANVVTLLLDFMYPTYSFIQLFFIFKYSSVIINKNKVLARFAIMHCIGANVCFWIWTILRETVDSLNHNKSELPASLHHIKSSHAETYTNISGTVNTESCQGPYQFSKIFWMFTPYLYPFTIEYSILVAGVMFIMWQNIGAFMHCSPSPCHSDAVSNVTFQADCHSSNKGLFAGLIVLVWSILSIILFFVAIHDRSYMEAGLLVNSVTELIVIILMILSVIPAYRQITKLDVNMRISPRLDDLLLFTCIPAFFVLTILSIIPSWNSRNYISLAAIVLQVIQVMIQTPFIIDGLRRCANSKKLRSEKPGRELLMFLIVCNVTMWITETFEVKSHSSTQDPRSLYYGAFIWSSITHLTFPLTMFYRFHSSVCMVDIWKSAYVKEQI